MNDELPARPPRVFAHTVQSFASPLVQPPVPVSVLSPVVPGMFPALRRYAHLFQSFASPLVQPPVPAHPVLAICPSVLPGPLRLAHTFQSFARPAIPVGSFPGSGGAGVATFVLSLEPGTKVTYSWGTDIFKSYSGVEQRCNTTGPMPRQRFEGSAFLLDGSGRDIRGTLQRSAAAGSTFSLALPHEELTVTADSTISFVTVNSTAACDWAIVTQRVVVVGVDGSSVAAVIQQVTTSGMLLDVTLGATGRVGARIMPVVQVLLDPQQGFSRYPVHVELWSIRAIANAFGWVGQDRMGLGAQITTYTVGAPVSVSSLTEQDLLIWDRSNAIDGTANESMLSMAETVDMGALVFGIGGATVPDWARPIRYSSADPADFQWLKAFLRQTLGRQRAFALSTSRPDLVFVLAAGATLKVQSSSVAGGGDYTAWYTSLAHRRLAISKSDGSVQYVAVTAAPVNNGDGTLSLTLDSAVSGTVAMVSFLEQVRFDNSDSDDFAVTWDGGVFTVDLLARTSEEVVVPPTLLMYDTVVDFALTITGTTPTHSEIVIAAGQTTYVRFTTNRGGINLGGIQVINGPTDGMVMTIDDVNNNSPTFSHEDTTWPLSERLWMPGRSNVNATGISFTFVYSSAVSRWVCLWGSG